MNKLMTTVLAFGTVYTFSAQAANLGTDLPKNLTPKVIEARGGGGGHMGGGHDMSRPEDNRENVQRDDQKAIDSHNTNVYNKTNNLNGNGNRNPYWTGYGYEGAPLSGSGQNCVTGPDGVTRCNY